MTTRFTKAYVGNTQVKKIKIQGSDLLVIGTLLTAAQTVPKFNQSASAKAIVKATSAQVIPKFDQAASAKAVVKVTGAQTIPKFNQVAHVNSIYTEPLFGIYAGYSNKRSNGTYAHIDTEAMTGKPVQALLAFSDHQASGGWGDGAGTIPNTMESSAEYNIAQHVASGKKLIWSQANAMGYGPYNIFPGSSMVDVAAGVADATFAFIGARLVHHGFADAIIRIGWEHNHTQFPWGNPWRDQNDHALEFIASFRRVVDRFRLVPGNNFKFNWCPNKCKPGHPSSRVDIAYPGDEYVDYVGLDAYDDDLDWMNPQGYVGGTRASMTALQRWDEAMLGNENPDAYAGGGRLAWLAKFGREHGKANIIGEWGAGGPASIIEDDAERPYALRRAYAGGDDGVYVTKFYQWMRDNNTYAHIFYDIHDTGINFAASANFDPGITGIKLAGYASETSNTLTTGVKTFQIASGQVMKVGQPLLITNKLNTAQFLEAVVTSYVGTTLTVSAYRVQGTGTSASWNLKPHPTSVSPNQVTSFRAALGSSAYVPPVLGSEIPAPAAEPPPEETGNLIAAPNDLTAGTWSWIWSGGDNSTVTSNSISRSVADGNPRSRMHGVNLALAGNYKYSFYLKNGSVIRDGSQGNAIFAVGIGGGSWSEIIINPATGAVISQGGSLAATVNVGAPDGTGERLVEATWTIGAAAPSAYVEFGLAHWTTGQVFGREFKVVKI